jgi:hypothetical protein
MQGKADEADGIEFLREVRADLQASPNLEMGVLMLAEFTKAEKAQFEKMNIVILSPMMIPEPLWIQSMANMVAWSWMNGLKIYQMGITHKIVVDWARNNLARNAVDHVCEFTGKRFTHIMWLDADHVFNPDLGCCLARHFLNKDIDAVSALYYSRTGATLPVVYVKVDNEYEYKHYPLIEVPPTLCEVDAFGFGACMMKREVFEIVPEPWFTIDYRAGEDIAFCVHAKKKGIRFFLDGSYILGHVGEPPIIGEAEYRAHLEANKELYADKIKVGLGGKNGNDL